MSVVEATTEEPATPPKAIVLELRDFTFHGTTEHSVRFTNIDLVLREGDLTVIHLDPALKSREFTSMLQGLSEPSHGELRFQGSDWSGTDYDRHFEMRGRIGRVFEGHAWVANLNVAENVTLASLHHEQSTEKNAKQWAQRFGLSQVSRKRPAFVEPSQLQIHQWIRAFLCHPALLLLERPMQSVPKSMHTVLCNAIDEARQSGTAVLWMTSQSESFSHEFQDTASHLRVESETLVAMNEEASDE
ncbi:MAG: ATP-binding cassette domain-containing protein [Rubripirellula sp.]